MKSSRFARYYHTARTAHLERLDLFEPGDFLYTRTRADWDSRMAASLPNVEKVGLAQVAFRVLRGRYQVVEIPEPFAIVLIPHLVIISLAAKLACLFRQPNVSLVTYAIENLDPIEKLASRYKLPPWLARAVLRITWVPIFKNLDAIAFGTDGSRQTYEHAVGPGRWAKISDQTRIRTFLALPKAAGEAPAKIPFSVCFLGTFEDRKGIPELLEAWEIVNRRMPEATLRITGKGPLLPAVIDFASAHAEVSIAVDPPRAQIRESLGATIVLVLLSKRTPTWREQVGLPILEGLEAGCRIVTTEETGIAAWLKENGHGVIADVKETDSIADLIIFQLLSGPTASTVLSSLPHADSRFEADKWMFRG